MLFAATSPERQGEEVRLYFSPDDAQAEAGRDRRIFKVTAHYDGQLRRLTALGHLYQRIDPGWMTSAEYRPDGSIVALGPIPISLFVPWSFGHGATSRLGWRRDYGPPTRDHHESRPV